MAQIDQRQMLPMGAVLDRRYRIIKYLASGGFGNTYVAEDMRLGGQVAVKEFFMRGTNHRSTDGTTVEVSNDTNTPVFNTQLKKFQREARRIFELRNDHIIHVSDLFDANGTSYYIMDLVKGTSLAEQTRQQPLSEQDARDVILQVLDALEAMHDAGLYHLDVKPGNIMRNDRGHCTLIDFGASKQLTADERNTLSSSTMAYTPGYAPLEQVAQQSKNIGPWTDFFALGATLYRLVTGDPPPEVDSDDTDADGRQFPYPPTVSDSLRHAISTLMNPSRRMRPKSAAEVRKLLEQMPQPVPSPPPEPPVPPKEETVITDPTPSSKEEKTNFTPTSEPFPDVPEKTIPPQEPPASPVSSQNEKTSLSSMSERLDENQSPSRKKSKYALWGALAALGLILFIILLSKGCGGEKLPAPPVEEEYALPAAAVYTAGDVDFYMVPVSGGTFTMGDEQGEDDEKPVHEVTLSDYEIGQTEVTQELWETVMGSNPSYFRGAQRPVDNVSWDDCQEFILRLNEMTGENFRLPTEAEWEYAARGGYSSSYSYSGSDDIDAVAWYDGNSGGETHEVGQKMHNELGIYDMSGNVWEWCQDWCGDYNYSPETNPQGPSSASYRVSRGGGWYSYARRCRVAFRFHLTPGYRNYYLGLRLAR